MNEEFSIGVSGFDATGSTSPRDIRQFPAKAIWLRHCTHLRVMALHVHRPGQSAGADRPTDLAQDWKWQGVARGGDTDVGEALDGAELFAELDGRRIFVADRAYTVEVYSISEHVGWRWLQLLVHGETRLPLTMCVPRRARVAQVIQAVSSHVAGLQDELIPLAI